MDGAHTPLPPHRLAQLANALGVSTPLPARVRADTERRAAPPPASRFLLHVVPPSHLPHDGRGPPVPNANGYHTQFRRGTLVPVHPTLQAQLAAIAKEYALPSTLGMILYLVSTDAEVDGPGPRLSEDIWRHLWTRVLQREDYSRSATPLTPRSPLTLAGATRSTPFLPTETGQLRPFLASATPEPVYTSPSTPSSVRSQNHKSAPFSSSQSEPDTPDTSVEDAGVRAGFLDLPGLDSPSLIPILAKVEFDIDKKKATWYDPWIRSRKANHAKRAVSRTPSGTRSNDEEDFATERVAPLELLTARKLGKAAFLTDNEDSAYMPLEDSTDTSEYEADDAAKQEDGNDPLTGIFPSDADTWAEMRSETRQSASTVHDPKIVDLALTPADLEKLPEPEEEQETGPTDEDEVRSMLQTMGSGGHKRADSRKLPPPLVLAPNQPSETTLVPNTPNPEDAGLAYLGEESQHDEEEEDEEIYTRVRSPADSDKRGGAVFDDLDLGLDPAEDFDESDPNDRRRSQFIMRAQLDEIERTMAQLSPRFPRQDLDEDLNGNYSSSKSLSPAPESSRVLSPTGMSHSTDGLPLPSPRLPHHPDPPESEPTTPSWPAVPFSSIKETLDGTSESEPTGLPSPPQFQLALNGVTTSAPKSYMTSRSPGSGPSESEQRKKEMEEEEQKYFSTPPIGSPLGSAGDSVIPLSPDPFGRYPSEGGPSTDAPGWETRTIGKTEGKPPTHGTRGSVSATSRFSTDSIGGEEGVVSSAASVKTNKSTLMSVKGIKNLWRKSTKTNDGRGPPLPPPPPTPTLPASVTSPPGSASVPQRPERPSQEQFDLPDVPLPPPPSNFGRLSPVAPQPSPDGMSLRPSMEQHSQQAGFVLPPRRSVEQQFIAPPKMATEQSYFVQPPRPSLSPSPPQFIQQTPGTPAPPPPAGTFRRNPPGPITPSLMQPSRQNTGLDRMYFDQESPYPAPIRKSPRPPSPPPLPAIPETNAQESVPQPRSSMDRGAPTGRGRRPSVINFGASSRTSATYSDLPPSPQLPPGYAASVSSSSGQSLMKNSSQRSRLTVSSVGDGEGPGSSPPHRNTSLSAAGRGQDADGRSLRSMASSRDSGGSRPSFDASQFEFVNPPQGMRVGHPFNALEQQQQQQQQH